jgi:hypothetical protein
VAAVVAVLAGGVLPPRGARATQPTLKIGTVLPFTSGLGESAGRAIRLNLYIKQHGGTTAFPPRCTTRTARAACPHHADEAVEQDKVHPCSRDVGVRGLAIVPTIAKTKIALVGMTGVTADEYRKLRSPYISPRRHA